MSSWHLLAARERERERERERYGLCSIKDLGDTWELGF